MDIEVTLMWGADRNPLWTRHFRAPVTVGDGGLCDTPVVPVFEVVADTDVLRIAAPPGASVLEGGERAEVAYRDFTFAISTAPAAPADVVVPRSGWQSMPFVYSALWHTLILGALAHYLPAGEVEPSREQLLTMKAYLERSTTRTQTLDVDVAADHVPTKYDDTHVGAGGMIGGSDSKGTARATGVNVSKAGAAGDDEADASFGIIALLRSNANVDAIGSDSPWARRSGGAGGLYDVDVGDALGVGLGLSGTGVGGVGQGAGIGLGDIGTRGYTRDAAGWDTTTGAPDAYGGPYGGRYTNSHYAFRWCHTYVTYPPRVDVHGAVDAEMIRRFVMRRDALLRRCDGGSLEGVVRVDFVIDRHGVVLAARDGGSTLADPAVVRCVVGEISKLELPESNGATRVSYPLTFSRRCNAPASP
jgi:hypothetical protein